MDIIEKCEAYYMYYSQHHFGQWCPLYAKLCTLTRVFKPRRSLNNEDDLSEESRELYEQLIERHAGLPD